MNGAFRSDRSGGSEVANYQPIDATSLYLKEIGLSPLLTAEEEVFYARQYKQGCQSARRRMIESNLRLVVRISRRYLNHGLELLDLVDEGNLGLMHAVEKYNPELGYRFSTYATGWIVNAIDRAIMNQSRTIRLPIHIAKELRKCLRVSNVLSQRLHHAPTPEDIALKVDKPAERVRKVLRLTERVASLDAPVGDRERHLSEIVADIGLGPEGQVESEDFCQALERWLRQLSKKQREVLIRRFGLFNHREQTLEQVGAEIGLTRERVRQIQSDALQRLGDLLLNHGLSREMLFADADRPFYQ